MNTLAALLPARLRNFLLHRSKGREALSEMGRRMREKPLGRGRVEASGDPRIHPRTKTTPAETKEKATR